MEKDGEKINGKSIMGLMMLAAGPGSKLKVHAEGHDASKPSSNSKPSSKAISMRNKPLAKAETRIPDVFGKSLPL